MTGRSFGIKIGSLIVSLAFYLISFSLLDQPLTNFSFLFYVLPLTLSSMFFGFKGGVLCGLVSIPLNWILLHFMRVSDSDFVTYMVSTTVFFVGIGLVSGLMVDLRTALKRETNGKENAEKRLKKTEGDYHGLVQRMNETLYRMSIPDGKYEFVSQSAKLNFGYGAEEFMAKPKFIMSIIHPDSYSFYKAKWEGFERGYVPDTYEYKIVDAEGAERWIYQTNQAIINDEGKVVALEGLCADVSQRKKAEKERREVYELAEQASKLKSYFLGNISHELRTPLNAILGFSQIILKQYREQDLPDEVGQYVRNIQVSGDKLLDIIDNILDISKIETGKFGLETKKLNLHTLLEAAYNDQKNFADEKGLNYCFMIDNKVPVLVLVDGNKLSRVLVNLLNNAIKFSPTGRTVFFGVHVEYNELVFTVKDDGIGIPHSLQQRIFELFEQADPSLTREYGGIGLGLSVVKKMVEVMHGRIQLESKPANGTCITVNVPFEPVALDDKDLVCLKPWLLGSKSTPSKVLLVEDDPLNQRLMQKLVSDLGVEIRIAENGQLGIAETLQFKPNLIFMDMHLPGMSGIEVSRQIRAYSQFANLPIVALSADRVISQSQAAHDAGIMDYLSKPVVMEDLVLVLDKYLN